MKTNQLLSRSLCSAMFAGILLFSSSVFAQVKIGTNPTTISANSNLEVEATNGKKVIIRKDVGTAVIENVPAGATTDGIMTVDAAGNVRQIPPIPATPPTPPKPYIHLNGQIGLNNQSPTTQMRIIAPLIEALGISYNASNGVITITESGRYAFTVESVGSLAYRSGQYQNNHCIYFQNGGADIVFRSCGRTDGQEDETAILSGTARFSAGNQLNIAATTSGALAVNQAIDPYNFNISIYKIAD